jgi:uncharacterized protein YegL
MEGNMKNNLTEIVFILDKSGSMWGLEQDTIGGFNSMLEKQKNEEGDALVTTVLFDDNYELLHDRKNIIDINLITEKEYYVGGSTALYDALGKTINKIGKCISDSAEENHPSKIMFVIITDGMENSSHEYSYSQIKEMVEHQKTKYSWEFIFLGANIDAVELASKIGISKDRAVNFCSDSEGTKLNYEAVCSFVSSYRKDEKVDSSWKSEIEKDYAKRNKKRR